MNFRNAAAAGLSLNMTATSPPVTTGASPLSMGGNENTLASVPTFALVLPEMVAPTKSPSISMAAFGGLLNMFWHRLRELGLQRVARAAGQPVRLHHARHGRERFLDRRVGPRDLVRGQLVVLVGAGLRQVDVLEPCR